MSFDANSPELRDSGRVAELALKLGRPYNRLTAVNWCMVQDHLLSFGPHRSLTDFPKRIQRISTQKILGRHFKVFNFLILWGDQYCHLDTGSEVIFLLWRHDETYEIVYDCCHALPSPKTWQDEMKAGVFKLFKRQDLKYFLKKIKTVICIWCINTCLDNSNVTHTLHHLRVDLPLANS